MKKAQHLIKSPSSSSRGEQWLDFFKNPEQFWDNREIKKIKNPSYADFRHIENGTSLWIDSAKPWVKEEIRKLKLPTSTQPVRAGYADRSVGVPAKVDELLSEAKACSRSGILADAKLVEEKVVEGGYYDNIFVVTTLIDMYARCASMNDAWRCFCEMEPQKRDAACWNALMLGFVVNGDPEKALRLFEDMQMEGKRPNPRSFVAALMACSSLAASPDEQFDPHRGMEIHELAKKMAMDQDVFVANNLIIMYSKLGNMEAGQTVFDRMPDRDVVSWNVLLTGYVEEGSYEEALRTFVGMVAEEVSPNSCSYTLALKACSELLAYKQGTEIHKRLPRTMLDNDAILATCVISFYASCGDVHSALACFKGLPAPLKADTGLWNAALQAHCLQGDSEQVFEMFRTMESTEGILADNVTFVVLLSSCSFAGLVDEAERLLHLMSLKYRIVPGVEHYTCMIGALARGNRLQEALKLVKKLETEKLITTAVPWTAILTAATRFGNVQVAKEAFEALTGNKLLNNLRSDVKRSCCPSKAQFTAPGESSAPYRMMESMYQKQGRVEEAGKMKRLREERCGDDKQITRSWWMSDDGRTHSFFPTTAPGYFTAWVSCMRRRATSVMTTHELPADGCSHSELLALAHAVHETPARATVRIFKQMRTCGDCHTTIKLIAREQKRVIFVKDVTRFHKFDANGCSCGDFW